jgi:hypothetical protein
MKGKIRSKGEMAPREEQKFVQPRSVVELKENEGLKKDATVKKKDVVMNGSDTILLSRIIL